MAAHPRSTHRLHPAQQHELAFYALESLLAHVAVLDEHGLTVAANRAWREFIAGLSGEADAWQGLDFLALLDAAGPGSIIPGRRMAAAIRASIGNEPGEPGFDYSCPTAAGLRWFNVHVTAYSGPPPGKVVVTITDITAQKEAELALRRSEERYRQATAAGIDLAMAVRVAAGHLYLDWVSGNPEGVTGYTAEELTALPSRLPLIYADDLPRVREVVEVLVAGAPQAQLEYRLLRKDGNTVWVSASARRVLETETPGEPILYISTTVIEARKQAEMERQVTEHVYRQAQAVAQVGHWTWDTQRNRVTWSDEMMRIFGLDPATYDGDLTQVIDAVIHPDDRPKLFAMNETAREGNPRSAEYRVVHPDGSVHDIFAVPVDRVADASGQVVLLTGIAQDITARKQAAAQVAALNERIIQLVNSVPEGVLLLDADAEVLVANPRARSYLDAFGAYDDDGRLVRLAGQPLEGLLTSPPRGRWHTLAANRRTYELLARPLESGPQLGGWVMVVRDVTDAHFVQQQLQRQERLAAVGQLAAGIAHDFNNLLSVILMYAELLAENPTLGERDRRRVATIADQSHRASQMIRQVLDFSRRSVLDREPLDLLPLINRQAGLLRHTLPDSIEVTLHVEPGAYRVLADPTRIEQVVMNLALNARDAMPHGGSLHIDLGHVTVTATSATPGATPGAALATPTGAAPDTAPSPEMAPSPVMAPLPELPPGTWVRLACTDTGTGMPPEVLAHIFEPFFTTKEPGLGTGLGLAQVHGIVAQHDGLITVSSTLGEGTAFVIYLPQLTALDASPAEVKAAATLARGQGETVLVVEDNEPLRTLLAEALDEWNYRVLTAANGLEALELVGDTQREGGPVALLLCDVVMPKMGGMALVRALRERGWLGPVLLMSGHPLVDDLEALTTLGVRRWIDKPPSLQQLAHALSEALEQRAG